MRKFISLGQLSVACFLIAIMVSPASLSAQEKLTEVERPAVLEWIKRLPTEEFRQEMGIPGRPSKIHIVANYDDNKDVALSKLFQSYGDLPAGITVLLQYYAGHSEKSALYQCPPGEKRCVEDTIEEKNSIDDETARQIMEIRGGRLFPENGGIEVELPTDRIGLLIASFSYSIGSADNDLRNTCMILEFYPKRFRRKTEPLYQGTYCYNFALDIFSSCLFEIAYGYNPSDAVCGQKGILDDLE